MKLVILDRDGTINVDSDEFIKSPEEWKPLPGALEAIARLNHAGWHVAIATNQSGLGRGLFDVAALNAIHARLIGRSQDEEMASELRRVCDRVAVLDAGHLVESGPVSEVFLHPQHATTRRFVAESDDVDEDAQHDDIAHVEGRLLRLTFTGEATWQPLLGRVSRETGIDYTILSGRIDRIKRLPYGQLTLAVTGDHFDTAAQRFADAGVHVEEIAR